MRLTNFYIAPLIFILIISLNSCFLVHGLKVRKLSKQSSVKNEVHMDTIPFTHDDGWITVEVKLSGTPDKKKFIVDTHAGTMLFESSFPNHPYKQVMSAKAKDFNGHSFNTEVVEIESLQLGDIEFEKVIGSVTKKPKVCADFDGILGNDLLRLLDWQIDFENNILVVSSDSKGYDIADDAMILPMKQLDKSGVFYLNIDDGKKGYESISVDLGAKTSFFLVPGTLRRLQKNGLVSQMLSDTGANSVSLAGKEKITVTNLGAIQRLKFYETDYVLDSVYFTSSKGSLEVFGCSFFKNFRTTIDYSGKRVILEPRKKNYSVSNLKNRGFYFERRDDKLYLGRVYENSPASALGLRTGQRVLAVDGEDTRETDMSKLCDINSRFNDTINLKVEDESGNEKEVVLELRPMSEMIYH